jgi:hypothetical protein
MSFSYSGWGGVFFLSQYCSLVAIEEGSVKSLCIWTWCFDALPLSP